MVQHAVVIGERDIFLFHNGVQLGQHDPGDGLEVILGELVKVDDLVHPVDKLGPQEGFQPLHGLFLPQLVCGTVKA